MRLLVDCTCPKCQKTFEDILYEDEIALCPVCQTESPRDALQWSPTNNYDPVWDEVFMRYRECSNKLSGKTPWRKSSFGQYGNE